MAGSQMRETAFIVLFRELAVSPELALQNHDYVQSYEAEVVETPEVIEEQIVTDSMISQPISTHEVNHPLEPVPDNLIETETIDNDSMEMFTDENDNETTSTHRIAYNYNRDYFEARQYVELRERDPPENDVREIIEELENDDAFEENNNRLMVNANTNRIHVVEIPSRQISEANINRVHAAAEIQNWQISEANINRERTVAMHNRQVSEANINQIHIVEVHNRQMSEISVNRVNTVEIHNRQTSEANIGRVHVTEINNGQTQERNMNRLNIGEVHNRQILEANRNIINTAELQNRQIPEANMSTENTASILRQMAATNINGVNIAEVNRRMPEADTNRACTFQIQNRQIPETNINNTNTVDNRNKQMPETITNIVNKAEIRNRQIPETNMNTAKTAKIRKRQMPEQNMKTVKTTKIQNSKMPITNTNKEHTAKTHNKQKQEINKKRIHLTTTQFEEITYVREYTGPKNRSTQTYNDINVPEKKTRIKKQKASKKKTPATKAVKKAKRTKQNRKSVDKKKIPNKTVAKNDAIESCDEIIDVEALEPIVLKPIKKIVSENSETKYYYCKFCLYKTYDKEKVVLHEFTHDADEFEHLNDFVMDDDDQKDKSYMPSHKKIIIEKRQMSSRLREKFERQKWLDQLDALRRLWLASGHKHFEIPKAEFVSPPPRCRDDAVIWCPQCSYYTWTVKSLRRHLKVHIDYTPSWYAPKNTNSASKTQAAKKDKTAATEIIATKKNVIATKNNHNKNNKRVTNKNDAKNNIFNKKTGCFGYNTKDKSKKKDKSSKNDNKNKKKSSHVTK